jgi:hypothetical protein
MSGPCLSPSVADRPLRPATRRCLGEPLPHQLADRPRDPPKAPEHFLTRPCGHVRASGISHRFQWLSRSLGQVSHVLLTRSPLSPGASSGISFDLHVLGTPPAFVLSQDQTLRRDLQTSRSRSLNRVAGIPNHHGRTELIAWGHQRTESRPPLAAMTILVRPVIRGPPNRLARHRSTGSF